MPAIHSAFRIIALFQKKKKSGAFVFSAGKARNEDVVEEISIRSKELDDDHEQLLVRDGIVVGLQQPNGRFVDETGVQVVLSRS